jgi:hypothetical protein
MEKKALLTVVVTGSRVRDVVEHLREELSCVVLSGGDITIAETDLSVLTNEVWLYEADGATKLALAKDSSGMSSGRLLTKDEVSALTEFGVCVEVKATYSRMVDFGTPPPEAIFNAMAQASELGFKVVDETEFETNYQGLGTEEAVARRWLRVRVPAWMNFAATL